ncbi:MAG: hypothetical protein HYV19_01550 [Gemmatimonadetes bacterium]|nr:hypothetical protein [Gemmatimonadota bacterium]
MGVMRTMLAVGLVVASVPIMAQPGRRDGDRGQGGRAVNRPDTRREQAKGDRGETRVERRDDRRSDPRGGARVDPRTSDRGDRGGWDGARRAPDPRVYRRDEPRVVVRQPVVIDRYDARGPRFVPPGRYGHPVRYRYGDRDYRHREYVTISTWFRALPPARLVAYGYYGPTYGGIRYVFRPGLSLSFAVYGQLSVLPYELEIELGELPWYMERRIYGNTVLVIDTRTRQIVDMFEIDY